MRTIDIEINQAKLKSYSVQLNDDTPIVHATIGLYSGSKKISDFSISTNSWHNVKFDLPPSMVAPIVAIANELEKIVTRECTTALGQLEAPK